MLGFKLEQMRKSLVNFLMAGDVQNSVDIVRVLIYRPPKEEG